MRGRSSPGRRFAPCRVPASLADWWLDGVYLKASADDAAGWSIVKSSRTSQVATRTASQSWCSLNANVRFLAQSRHFVTEFQCQPFGVKRTLAQAISISRFPRAASFDITDEVIELFWIELVW